MKGEEAESGVAMETIVLASPVIRAAGMSLFLLFLSLFNTSDTTEHSHRTQTHTHRTQRDFYALFSSFFSISTKTKKILLLFTFQRQVNVSRRSYEQRQHLNVETASKLHTDNKT